jgi:nucleotide-binding universal stress UspA family protein
MDLATSIARLEESTLHIVHAWELTGRSLDRSRSEITEAAMNELLSENEEVQRRELDQVLQGYRLQDISHRIHLARGRPESVILELAETEQVDLIVMGTVCRTGVPGFVIGNTAERILQRAECSVLTVKPEGFVTSVAPQG